MASENVVELTEANFEDTIKEGVVVVDLWAPWCGPCQMQGPIIDKVADQVGEKATICKLNVDDAQSIAANLGVQSIPTILVFKDGQEAKRLVGLQQEPQLMEVIDTV